MRKFVVALVLAPVIGAALAAPAVFARSTIGRYPAYTLTKDDLALMRSADRDQMDGKPDGTTNSWQMPRAAIPAARCWSRLPSSMASLAGA